MKISRFFPRFFLLCFMCVWFGMCGLVSIVTIIAILAGKGAEFFPVIAMLFVFYLFGGTLFSQGLQQLPVVALDETGVKERILFKAHTYQWDEIKQAGILWRLGKGTFYNQIVLLKPGGSRRRYKDKTFVPRNDGYLIQIPYSELARNYIVKYYGPLDFDLSNGRSEQSIVVD